MKGSARPGLNDGLSRMEMPPLGDFAGISERSPFKSPMPPSMTDMPEEQGPIRHAHLARETPVNQQTKYRVDLIRPRAQKTAENVVSVAVSIRVSRVDIVNFAVALTAWGGFLTRGCR